MPDASAFRTNLNSATAMTPVEPVPPRKRSVVGRFTLWLFGGALLASTILVTGGTAAPILAPLSGKMLVATSVAAGGLGGGAQAIENAVEQTRYDHETTAYNATIEHANAREAKFRQQEIELKRQAALAAKPSETDEARKQEAHLVALQHAKELHELNLDKIQRELAMAERETSARIANANRAAEAERFAGRVIFPNGIVFEPPAGMTTAEFAEIAAHLCALSPTVGTA